MNVFVFAYVCMILYIRDSSFGAGSDPSAFCVYLYATPLLSHSFAVDVPMVFMQCGHRCRTFFVLSIQNGTTQQGMQPIKQSPAAKHQVMHPV